MPTGRRCSIGSSRAVVHLLRPFEVLLHSPSMAEAVAELGHVVRFGSHLADADRELVTLATGRALDRVHLEVTPSSRRGRPVSALTRSKRLSAMVKASGRETRRSSHW